jgi:hypothetical protein
MTESNETPTPLTNAEIERHDGEDSFQHYIDFARSLERKLAELEAENAALREFKTDMEDAFKNIMAENCKDDRVHCTCVPTLRQKVKELEELLGQKLAACSCAAIMDTKETHSKAKIEKDNPFWSPAYEDVMKRTSECIALRARVAELETMAVEMLAQWDDG